MNQPSSSFPTTVPRTTRLYPLRWISRMGLLGLLLALSIGLLGFNYWVPPRPEFPASDSVERLALQALEDGEFTRAYLWLKHLREAALAAKDATATTAADLPSQAELIAGFYGGAARDTLSTGAVGTQDFFNDVVSALWNRRAEIGLPERIGREWLVPFQRALMHLVMTPTLTQIARTACGLPPLKRWRTGSESEVGLDSAGAEVQLPVAEVERRLIRWFEFVRDSVVAMPDPTYPMRRPYQYPLDTLYEGAGWVPEVNWLLIEGAEQLADVWAFELCVAPSAVRPVGSRWSEDRESPLREQEIPVQTRPSRVATTNATESRLVVVLMARDRDTKLVAFDVVAGAPLLNESGGLLNLLAADWDDMPTPTPTPVERLHPVLREALPYGRDLVALTRGVVVSMANPLRSTKVAALMHQLGLRVRPRPGPSPFSLVLGPQPWSELPPVGVTVDGRREGVPLTMPEMVQAIIATAWPTPPLSLANAFPYRWRFEHELWPRQQEAERQVSEDVHQRFQQPISWRFISQNWLVSQLMLDVRQLLPAPNLLKGLQEMARDDNRRFRQRALDYQRPNDGLAGFEQAISQRMTWDEILKTAWPSAEDEDPMRAPVAIRQRATTRRGEAQNAGWLVWEGETGFRPYPGVFTIQAASAVKEAVATIGLLNLGPRPLEIERITVESVARDDTDFRGFEVVGVVEPLVVVRGTLLLMRFRPPHEGVSQANLWLRIKGMQPVGVRVVGQAPRGLPVLGAPNVPVAFASPLTALPAMARRMLPPVYNARQAEIQSVQARFGAAWTSYVMGAWQNCGMHANDYLVALDEVRLGAARNELPGAWRWLAHWLQGRAMWMQNRPHDARQAWANLPSTGPLGAAARLAEAGVMTQATPYLKE